MKVIIMDSLVFHMHRYNIQRDENVNVDIIIIMGLIEHISPHGVEFKALYKI